MTLEQQVCSLPLAQRLKELGVEQESLYWWCGEPDCQETIPNHDGYCESCSIAGQTLSAFTVAELGEMLPWRLRGFVLRAVMNILDEKDELKQWELAYWEEGHEDEIRFQVVTADTEADARAKMLIYLLENKLITV